MRVSDLVSLGGRYLILGIVLVGILGVIVFAAYVICKKKCRNKKLPYKRVGLYGAFICYLIVVFGATVLSRAGLYEDMVRLKLFYSYKEAWNNFSIVEWRNIILNILMFVPFGFLLPYIHERFKQARWTYAAGLGLTFLIELLQMILRRGIFELDDLMDNLIGTMIGFGCYQVWEILRERVSLRRKSEKFTSFGGKKNLLVLMYQLPLIVTVAAFGIIFGVYEKQELGNLRSEYIVKQKIGQVICDLSFSEEERMQPVYQMHIASLEDAAELADEVFQKFGDSLDPESEDAYETMVVYYSLNRKNIWIDYKGCTYRYSDHGLMFGDRAVTKVTDATEDQVRSALEQKNIYVPKEMTFMSYGQGYRFEAKLLRENDLLYDGTIECEYGRNGEIITLKNSLLQCSFYKEEKVISQAEAYRRLCAGEFYHPSWNADWTVEIYDAYLDYEKDSKGFYQPVYRFDAMINGIDGYINIPAIDK